MLLGGCQVNPRGCVHVSDHGLGWPGSLPGLFDALFVVEKLVLGQDRGVGFLGVWFPGLGKEGTGGSVLLSAKPLGSRVLRRTLWNRTLTGRHHR